MEINPAQLEIMAGGNATPVVSPGANDGAGAPPSARGSENERLAEGPLLPNVPLTPSTLGDLVGYSFRAFRQKLRFFFDVFLWPVIFSVLGLEAIQFVIGSFGNLRAVGTLGLPGLSLGVGYTMIVIAALITISMAQWELAIRCIAVMRAVNLAESYKDSYANAKKRKWSILWVYTIAVLVPTLVIMLWSFALVISMILCYYHRGVVHLLANASLFLEGLGVTVTFAWSVLWTSLLLTVVASENLKFMQTLRRTTELTRRYLWRGGSYSVLLMLVLFSLAAAMTIPAALVSVFDVHQHGGISQLSTYQPAWWVQMIGCICQTFQNIVLIAVATLADAFYYNDARFRAEGLDIQTKLNQLRLRASTSA